MGDACISGELKLPLMRYEVSLVPEHVAKRNVKDPLYLTIIRFRTIIIIRNRTTEGAKDEFTTILL